MNNNKNTILQSLFQIKWAYHLAILCSVAMFAGNAHATLISHTYHGNTMNTGSSYVSVEIITEGALPANKYIDLSTYNNFVSLTISAYGMTLTQPGASSFTGLLYTSDNSIENWYIQLTLGNVTIATINSTGYLGPILISADFKEVSSTTIGAIINNPGTFNATVPEPASLILLLIGMAGLTTAKRCKQVKPLGLELNATA